MFTVKGEIYMTASAQTTTIELPQGHGWKMVLNKAYSVFTNVIATESEYLVLDQDKDIMLTFSLTGDTFSCIQSVYGNNYTVDFPNKTITLHTAPDVEE